MVLDGLPKRTKLCGRTAELAIQRHHVRSPGGGSLLVAEPGMGRTALLQQLVDELRSRGRDVVFLAPNRSIRTFPFAALSRLLTHPPTSDDPHNEFIEAIRRRATEHLTLIIDDFHYLDEQSINVVECALSLTNTSVIGSIDIRFVSVVDEGTRWNRISQLSRSILTPLEFEDVAAIIADVLDPPFDVGTWLERCQGNPSMLVDLLDVQDHALPWPSRDPEIMPDVDRELLEILAVTDEMPVAALEGSRFMEALSRLAECGIIATSSNDLKAIAWLRHPLDRRRVRSSLGPLVIRLRTRQAAELLDDRRAMLDPRFYIMAMRLSLASGREIGRDDAISALSVVLRESDGQTALQYAKSVVANYTAGFAEWSALAQAAFTEADHAAYDLALRNMREVAADDAERAALAVLQAIGLWLFDADGVAAVELLAPYGLENGRLGAAIRARIEAEIGRYAAARTSAEALLAGPCSRQIHTHAIHALADVARAAAAPASVVPLFARHLDDGQRTRLVYAPRDEIFAPHHALVLSDAGDLSGADRLATRCLDVLAPSSPLARAYSLIVLGIVRLEVGAPGAARDPLETALHICDSSMLRLWARAARSALGLAHAMTGDSTSAAEQLDLLSLLPAAQMGQFAAIEPRARAWMESADGQPQRARQILDHACTEFTAAGNLGAALECAHDLLSLGRPKRLAEVVVAGYDMSALRRVEHARATVSRDLSTLFAIAAEFAELGNHRRAAECATTIVYSAILKGDGVAARKGRKLLATAVSRFDQLVDPAVADGDLERLSQREREVVTLASRGLTNKEIANRLYISSKTVENHLTRCYARLGLRSRSQLMQLFVTRPNPVEGRLASIHRREP